MATLHLVKTSSRAAGGEAACHKTLKLEFQLRTKDAIKYFCYFICNGNNSSSNNNNNNNNNNPKGKRRYRDFNYEFITQWLKKSPFSSAGTWS